MVFLHKQQIQINLIIFNYSETYLQFIRDIEKLFEFHQVINIIKIPAGRIEILITTKILRTY